MTPLHTAARMALDAPEPWMPIETAPKHTEVLVWREDSGPFIAKLTTPDAVVSPEEMEREGLEFPDDFEEWWSDAYGWQEGGEKPTHWMPLPAAPGAAPPAAPAVPLTIQQYNMIPELCAIKPSLYESIVRAIERAHGIGGGNG